MTFVICSRVGEPPGKTSFFGPVAGSTDDDEIFDKDPFDGSRADRADDIIVFAQGTAPTPWVLSPDMGYGYDKDGKTFSYKMGTNNAGVLLKGAKKVPKGTLFFIGQNGQLYMRTGPFLEGDGKFMFGPN